MRLLILIISTVLTVNSSPHRRTTTVSPENSLPNEDECGPSESYRIYNGQIAEITDHPWFALIYINHRGGIARCGGSLINSKFILTAAHCFDKIPGTKKELKAPKEISILLSEHVLDQEDDCDDETGDCYNAINMTASRVIIHKQYGGKSKSYINDIALIELKWPMSFNEGGNSIMRPVCLPVSDEQRNMNLTGMFLNVAGFGRTEILRTGSEGSSIKRKVDLRVLSFEECQTYFTGQIQLTKNQKQKITLSDSSHLCAIGSKYEDTCNGDSGGPFVLLNKHQMGIVSFGLDECGKGQIPAIFTKVSSYVDWIKQTIASLPR